MAKKMDRTGKAGVIAPKLGLIMSTALASVALTGCTSSAAPAESSFAKAQVALEKGQVDKAVTHAEAAVLAEPRNASFRAMLGAAYLESGRFDSAATSFADAMALGNEDPRTVLSYALAKTAMGDNAAAVSKLNEWDNAINPADLGLALALAGEPERGVHILVNTLRGGQNTAKVRQNLAYSYALSGNWRAARVMMMEDVPADQIDARLSDWAANAKPEDYQVRVASLLNVTPSYDNGQPTHLALANFPGQETMFAEAQAQAPAKVADAKPAITTVPNTAKTLTNASSRVAYVSNPVVQNTGGEKVAKPVAAPKRVAQARKAPAPAPAAKVAPKPVPKAAPTRQASSRFVSKPVVQSVPKSAAPTRVAANTSQRRMAATTGTNAGTHLVQLGSFSSRAVAEAKWKDLQSKFTELRGRDVVITEAKVNGKTYFRVAAAGFGAKSARAMCGTAKAKGTGCFAYAASSPPKGAVDRGVRIAARTR